MTAENLKWTLVQVAAGHRQQMQRLFITRTRLLRSCRWCDVINPDRCLPQVVSVDAMDSFADWPTKCNSIEQLNRGYH